MRELLPNPRNGLHNGRHHIASATTPLEDARQRLVSAWVAMTLVGTVVIGASAGCTQGLGTDSTAILGGQPDTGGQFNAVVQVHGSMGCSGTLMRRDRVITAAHCVAGQTSATVTIIAPSQGIPSLNIEADVRIAPGFVNDMMHHNDLAVLRLRQLAPETIALPRLGGREPDANASVWLVGYGRTSCNSSAGLSPGRVYGSNVVDVRNSGLILLDNTIGSSGTLPWHGDSGGPLFVREAGINYLVGVDHQAPIECQSGTYVDVAAFMPWLAEELECPQICGNGQCAQPYAPFGTLKAATSPAIYEYNGWKHGYVDGTCYMSAECTSSYNYTCVTQQFLDAIPTAPAMVCTDGSFMRAAGQPDDTWRIEAGRRRRLSGAWTAAKFSTRFGGAQSNLVVDVCAQHMVHYPIGEPIWPPCGGAYGGCVGAGEVCTAGECRISTCGSDVCTTGLTCGDGVCSATENCNTCSNDCGVCPPSCGDGACTAGETCSTCPSDCNTCPTSCALDPGSLLANGTFDNGWNCWEEEDHFGHASSAIDASNFGAAPPSIQTTVVTAGLDYEVQPRRRMVSVVAGRSYRLTFWAKASSARSIIAELGQDGSPWTNRGLYASMGIGTAGATYATTFVATATDPTAKLGFHVGDRTGTVWLDDVRLEEQSTAVCSCADHDGDGFYDIGCGDPACTPRTDCNDIDAAISPAQDEVCGNGQDDDCDSGSSDACPVGCALDPGSILADGDFSNGWGCWEEEDHFGHASSATDNSSFGVGAPSITLTVTTAGLNYEVQARQRGVAVVAGRTYRLTFWARASSQRTVIAEVGQDGAPWTNRGLYAPIAVGPVGALYSTTFVATVSDPSAKLGIQVGDIAGQVWFDDIRIVALN